MDSFYADIAVRERLMEFLGGDSLENATAMYITSSDTFPYDPRALHLPTELHRLLDANADVARSLADERSLLLHLDIEYVDFDSDTGAFLDPVRAFELQEPVVKVIEEKLLKWGIRPLHLITGQGHHFVWRVRRDNEVAKAIAALSPAPELVERCEERVPPLLKSRIDQGMHREFAGLALLMEHIAHEVKRDSAAMSEVPVEITAVHVGPGASGHREMISIDISEYGDPLHTRMVRMPFTNYRKPRINGLEETLGLTGNTQALRAIPLYEMDYRGALQVRTSEQEVKQLARRACVRIPEQSLGTKHLLKDYLASRLRHFHEYYYSCQHDPVEKWVTGYRAMKSEDFPPCASWVLVQPNDRLLKPAGMQMITRTLMAMDWHPRHVAGFIRSIFEDPAYEWGVGWTDYEAGTRADFYVRVFSGLYTTGIDRLVDFNCLSTAEKGFAVQPHDTGQCLEPLRERLLQKQCL